MGEPLIAEKDTFHITKLKDDECFSLVKYSSSVINKSQHNTLITLYKLQHQSHKKVSNFYKDFCSPSYALTFVMTDWVKSTKNRNIANG